MKRLLIFGMLALFAVSMQAQNLSVTNLKCDYRENPIGVDIVKPVFNWQLISKQNNVLQTAYRVLVADDAALLAKNMGNIWDSKKIQSSSSIQVKYNGEILQPAKKYFWKLMIWDNKGNQSAWSKVNNWQMGLLSESDWQNAKWIGYENIPDSGIIIPAYHGNGKKAWGKRPDVLPLMRKSFSINKKIKQATAFISGLGHFEMSINGNKVGDHFLDPGWTNYTKQALYVSFDVTKQLITGNNAIGVMLGNGFYYVPGERYRKLTGAFGYPKMICNILIEYANGTKENIISNESWKTATSSIIFSSIYGGEDYDANKEQPGWDKALFNDTGWKNAVIVNGHPLQSQTAEPLKVMQVFTPIKQTKIKEGVWVFDCGQNMSGIPQITVQGKKGDTVKIIPAELLNDDGTVNQKATGSPHYYLYILKGTAKETWQPRFTYYGYRYIQVENVTAIKETGNKYPLLVAVKGLHTSNAAARVGNFNSSNELFNKTDKLIDWSIKSNMASVLTDCPHREKLGWLEETHLVGTSVQYEYDIATLCRKAIKDMMMSQTSEGLIPEIAPEFVKFDEPFRDSPEWGSAAIILPWYVYKWYGDKALLEDCYPMMKRYIDYLKTKAKNNILTQGLGDWYDLGPNKPGFPQLTVMGITATATYYYDLTILSQIANLLGKKNDANDFTALSAGVKTAYNNSFFNDTTKQYGTGSQTSNAISLYMGLVEKEHETAVLENIVKDIRSHNNSLTAGDIGYRYLLKVLDAAGRSDVIFDMNNRSDVPGYGYQLAKGATALTESWQALPNVSNNHLMLGHIMEWFYQGLAGISQAANSVAYKNIVIRPQVVGDVTHAAASFQSPYGEIKSAWKKTGNIFELNVTVPVNTVAEIYLPGTKKPVKTGSGKYKFAVTMK
jgi:alpha-L-rhamnosidase